MRFLLALLLLFPLAARAQFTSPAMLSALPTGGVTPPPPSCSGTGYSVSAAGNDGNNGISAPWLTLAHASLGPSYAGGGLSPGQCLNLRGGDTFTGCLFMMQGGNIASSSAASPIIVQSYGTGIATIVPTSLCQATGATATKPGAVMIDGRDGPLHGVVLQNIAIHGLIGTLFGNGIVVQSTSNTDSDNITIQNVDIGGFGTAPGSSYAGADIAILGSGNVTYVNNVQQAAGCSGSCSINNAKVLNNAVHGLSGVTSADTAGILTDGAPGVNILISGNTVFNIGAGDGDTAAGITVLNTNASSNEIVEHNVIHDIAANTTGCGGMSGIETAGADGVTIRFNEVYRVQYPGLYPGGCDWVGIDLDGDTTNSIVEYNYTHDNSGAGYLMFMGTFGGPGWTNNIYRYNISENDANYPDAGGDPTTAGAMKLDWHGLSSVVQIYGNIIYQGNSTATAKTALNFVNYTGSGTASVAAGSIIQDNLMFTTGSNLHVACNGPWSWSGINWSHNAYAGTAFAGSGTCSDFTTPQTAAIYANPNFAGPVPAGTLSWTPPAGPQPGPAGYKPTNSAYSGTGLLVSGNGGRDYFGVTLTNPPPIGASVP